MGHIVYYSDCQYFLEKYKVSEDEKTIVYRLPLDFEFDFVKNRDFILSQFADVEISLSSEDRYFQTITCYKSSYGTPSRIY